MRTAMSEMSRRRERQRLYNEEHGITPQTIKKSIRDILSTVYEGDYAPIPELGDVEVEGVVRLRGGLSLP